MAARPLIVTTDPDLLDDLLRLAATADVEVDVAVDAVAARSRWSTAPLVLLGADLAPEAAGMPPRADVLLIGRGSGLDGTLADASAGSVLRLPEADEEIVGRLAECSRPAEPSWVVGVLGGCGGAGATVFSAALALTAARRREPSLLVDLDPLGGGIDLLLGLEEAAGLRWPDLAAASGRLAPAALRDSLPGAHGVSVLAHARPRGEQPGSAAVCAVLEAGRRGGGAVVLDMARQSLVEAASGLLDSLVVVVPAEVRAVAAAVQVARDATPLAAETGLVVRRPPASTLSGQQVAGVVGLPLLGELRAEPGLSAGLQVGHPLRLRRRGPLATLCDRLIDSWRPGCAMAAA